VSSEPQWAEKPHEPSFTFANPGPAEPETGPSRQTSRRDTGKPLNSDKK